MVMFWQLTASQIRNYSAILIPLYLVNGSEIQVPRDHGLSLMTGLKVNEAHNLIMNLPK